MKIRRSAIAVSLLAGLLFGAVTTATPAAADSSKSCNSASIASKAKGKLPVVFVHGLVGNAGAWGDPNDASSMAGTIKRIPGVYLDEIFDYSSTNTKWVTDDNIGPRLANRIDCLAQASGRKPVVVGHSMGGAAARLASSLTVNGRKVANEFGMLVTLGTPNLGSGLANMGTDFVRSLCPARTILDHSLCDFGQISALKGLRENSDELNKLPWMPRNVPVLALAGDVSVHTKIFNADLTMDTNADLVVSKNSALQDIRTTSAGGGSKSFACTMEVGLHLPNCWHSALTSNGDAIKTVKDAVGRFAAATKPNPFAEYTSQHWYRHGSGFDVHKDHTATMTITSGAGGLPECGYWCTFNSTLKLVAQNDGSLKGTYAKVWFSSMDTPEAVNDGGHLVKNPPASVTDEFPHVGDTTIITLKPKDDQLHISGLGDPGSGWCGPQSKDLDHTC